MQAAPGLGRAKLIPTWEVRFPSLLRPGRSHATCPFRPPRKITAVSQGGTPPGRGVGVTSRPVRGGKSSLERN